MKYFKNIQQYTERINKRKTVLMSLATIVVFITTYMLVLPAITLEQDEAEKQGGIDLPKSEQSVDKQDQAASDDPKDAEAKKEDVKDKDASADQDAKKDEAKTEDKTDSDKTEQSSSDSAKAGLAFEGEGYSITAKAGSDAKLPEDTKLTAKEVKSDEKKYDALCKEAEKALNDSPLVKDDVSVKSAKFYDITLESDGKEVEPAADVNVKITYDKSLKMSKSGDVYVIHFAEDKNGKLKPEVLKDSAVDVKSKAGTKSGTIEVSDVAFDASGFSMYGLVETTTLEETVVTADGKNYKVSVTYDADAKVPEGAKLAVSEIGSGDSGYDDYVAKSEKALDMDKGSAGYARLFDIKILDKDGEKVKIQAPVDVKIELTDKEDKEKTKVVHFADGSEKGDVVKAAVKDDTLSFAAEGFSVYAVIGGTEPTARMAVNFHVISYNSNNEAVDTLLYTAYVKREDCDNEEALEQILYDPGAGDLEEGEVFRGWSLNKNYTTDEATTTFNGDFNNPSGAMTIEDIREWAASKKDTIEEGEELQTYNIYAMILKNFKVQYVDPDGVSLGTDSAYMLRNQEKADYTISMTYTSPDEDHNFEGWVIKNPSDKTKVTEPVPETNEVTDEGVTYDLYTVNTKVKISGDVTFTVLAPEGKWLIFHEVEKGATYTAPQFLKPDQEANMPDPDSMHLLGYEFEGWYTTEDYQDGTEFSGGTITQKTNVYAKWKKATWAPYTVIIWKQNLDGTYAYAESVQLAGTVDTTVNSLSITNNNDADYLVINGQDINRNSVQKNYRARHTGRTGETHTYENADYVGFNCDRFDQNVKINPEGNAVVNVYYDRITYTVKIYHARQSGDNYNVPTTRSNNNTLSLGGMNWTGTISYHRNNNNTWANGYQGPPKGVQTEQSGSYTYYYTTITAKYGEDITNQWPKYEDYADLDNNNQHGTYYTFVSWYMMNDAAGYRGNGSGLDTFKGVISKMDEKLLGDITRSNADANYLIGRYDDRTINIYTYQIWKEALKDEDGNVIIPAGKQSKVGADGLTYYLEDSIQANSNAAPSGTQAPDYIGFEHIESMDVKPNLVNNRATIQFYYHRVKNSIIYRDGTYFSGNNQALTAYPSTGEDVEVENILYGSDLDSYNKVDREHNPGTHYKTDYPSSYDGFVFEGWYLNKECTEPYTFTTMPDSNITVYAKFRQSQYRVFLRPNVPSDVGLTWGSENQQMNFRVSYGDNVSTPTGVRDDGYEFVGWYMDPEFKKPFDGDAYVLNDDITVDYDKTDSYNYTDPMDKYGNGATTNADVDRWWVEKKLDLFAKWRKVLDGAEGITVLYDVGDGTGNIEDPSLYKDKTNAVAQSAPEAPSGKKFLYWVLQRWDSENGKYVDIHPIELVYPGDLFEVSYENARTITETDPDTGENINKYYVQLRAEYGDPGKETPTHIWWYSNFDDNDVIKVNETASGETATAFGINEAVIIKPEDTFTRDGYKFLGWARVDSTDDEGNPLPDEPKLHPELGPDNLFLKYVEANGSTPEHFEAKNDDDEWVTVTQVAADEKQPYHDLYAVWAKLYTVTVVKSVVGTEADKDSEYAFKSTGLNPVEDTFNLSGREKTNNNNEVTQTNKKVYLDIPQYTEFQVTEDDYTENYVTTIEATYTYVNDKGETVTETIALDPNRENKLSTGELTVNGNTTITYTNARKALKVSVWKTDEDHNALTGAKFVLYKADDYDDTTEQPKAGATPVMAETEVGSNGLLLLDVVDGEIPLGEYRLVETVAPAGYNLADSAIRIVLDSGVSATQGGNQSEVYVKGNDYWVAGQDKDTYQIRVWNNPGAELPSTGGPGTTWIYLLGTILLLGCGITLIARRRIRSN